MRCLSSPYGWNHQPSAAERREPFRCFGSPPSSAGSSGDVLTDGLLSFQGSGPKTRASERMDFILPSLTTEKFNPPLKTGILPGIYPMEWNHLAISHQV